MSDLAEKVTRALDTWVDPEKVRDAIDVVLEEAARVADRAVIPMCETSADRIAAAAIRALKDKP